MMGSEKKRARDRERMKRIRAAQSWQPITSAPTDRYFLAWDGVRQFVCEWGNLYKRTLRGGDQYGWVNVYWPAGNQAHPKVWMELPKPPPPTELEKAEDERHSSNLVRAIQEMIR